MKQRVAIWKCLKCDCEFEERQPCPACGSLDSEFERYEDAFLDESAIEHYDDLSDLDL